jgi:hypothetical protein
MGGADGQRRTARLSRRRPPHTCPEGGDIVVMDSLPAHKVGGAFRPSYRPTISCHAFEARTTFQPMASAMPQRLQHILRQIWVMRSKPAKRSC